MTDANPVTTPVTLPNDRERLVDLLARNVADNLSAAESMRRVGRALVAHHAAHLADDASILLVHWPGPGDGQ